MSRSSVGCLVGDSHRTNGRPPPRKRGIIAFRTLFAVPNPGVLGTDIVSKHSRNSVANIPMHPPPLGRVSVCLPGGCSSRRRRLPSCPPPHPPPPPAAAALRPRGGAPLPLCFQDDGYMTRRTAHRSERLIDTLRDLPFSDSSRCRPNLKV
jgi:hypothetical protein